MGSISESINQFLFDLCNELKDAESDKNIGISPLSISAALLLLLLGSRENTAAQIEKVLHLHASQPSLKDEKKGFGKLCGKKLKKDEVAEVHNQFHELLSLLLSQKSDCVITIANAAFTQLGFPLSEEYVKSAEELYQAKVKPVDFRDDKARREINSWVEKKTEGKIKDLFPEHSVEKSTSLILVNAVYFKGQWMKKFKVEDTRNAPFYVTKDKEISVPMMSQRGKFNVGVIDEIDAQMIELPYGTGDICMYIILPNEVAGLREIEEQINAETLMKWTDTKNLTSMKVDLEVPRFKIETSYNLAQYLIKLGMVDAFSQQKANLSGISDVGLYVSQVIHKCFIDVNEEGTEAAAATGVVLVPKSLQLPLKFIANHPFLSVIKSTATGMVIFYTKVYSPEIHKH